MRKRPLAIGLACAVLALAHEGMRQMGPTKAAADLKLAREAMAAAKRKLTAQGRYACCVRPSCSLCARVNGSCNCAANVKAGKGACGECYGGWKAGRGVVSGADARSVTLLTADQQSCPLPAKSADAAAADLRTAAEALLRAKRILAGEKRYACCIRGGCSQCAHEAYCPCGGDVVSKHKGVCGECLDRWRAGQGAFDGVDPLEVTMALPETAMEPMTGIPAAAPMEMISHVLGGWTMMEGGQFFGIYNDQSGARGRDKIFSTNWVMFLASRRTGPGTFTLHTMLSLEPATITSGRYPLLFATGETYHGIPIINGQHPHDLFMELAASYRIRLGERASFQLYGGPRGEPALGPPAYPHRPSASEDPVGTIGHHQQDSTHISTNVATAGVTYGPVTWEVSGFHGREPDEKRWGIESGPIDSLSSRLTVSPGTRWSGQFSIGRINRAETTHPLRPALRTTASLMYSRPFASGMWSTSLIWGRNHELEYTQLRNVPVFPQELSLRPRHIVSVPTRIPGQIYNSYLAESTLRWRRNWIWGRAESADKDSTVLFEEAPFVLLVDETRLARVQAYTAGYERELPSWTRYLSTGIGSQFTIYHVPPLLSPIYGASPVGVQMFVRVRLLSGTGR
jgi:hypothetical protein